jgi:hypothetical protein
MVSAVSQAPSRKAREGAHAGIHQTIRVTPAMEAGLTDRVWSIAELVATQH